MRFEYQGKKQGQLPPTQGQIHEANLRLVRGQKTARTNPTRENFSKKRHVNQQIGHELDMSIGSPDLHNSQTRLMSPTHA